MPNTEQKFSAFIALGVHPQLKRPIPFDGDTQVPEDHAVVDVDEGPLHIPVYRHDLSCREEFVSLVSKMAGSLYDHLETIL